MTNTNTTTTTSGGGGGGGAADLPEALRSIQRFEVVDCIDDKHVPAVIPKPHGPWVRYEDHIAALAAGQATTAQAAPAYKDSTPDLHIGDSAFESWYSTYSPMHKSDKQRARDAYAAGMGDPLVTAAPAGESLRTDALCDLSYSHGLKAGWNYCASDDLAGFERAQKIGTEALRTLKSTTAQAAPADLAGPSKAITASIMRDDGGDHPAFCLMVAYRSQADAEAALELLAAAPTTQPAPQLPERDANVPAEQQGLFRKFDVRRVDGSDQPGGKHHGCRYFVLDVDHDPRAHAALTAYAAACESSHPKLAADLRSKWGAAPTTQPVSPTGDEFQPCPSCFGKGVEGDADDYGNTIDVTCGECNGSGRAQGTNAAQPAPQQEAQEPDFWTVCAQYEGGDETGWIPLPGYSNETEHGVKNLVLQAARKEGYKGTVTGRLMELNWEIRPVYLAPWVAPQPSPAVQGCALDVVLDAFENKTRGIPQAHIAAALVAELRAAIEAASTTPTAQVDALDAARYRFLRNSEWDDSTAIYDALMNCPAPDSAEELDAAVDAARAEQEKKA